MVENGNARQQSSDLLMECVDEDLTPSQQEANRKAAREYKSAIEKVEVIRSVSHGTDQGSNAAGPESWDVIVLDDDDPEPETLPASTVPASSVQLQLIDTSSMAARPQATATISTARAPVMAPTIARSVASPQIFLTFPSGQSNSPMIIPSLNHQVWPGTVVSSNSVMQMPLMPITITPRPMHVIQPQNRPQSRTWTPQTTWPVPVVVTPSQRSIIVTHRPFQMNQLPVVSAVWSTTGQPQLNRPVLQDTCMSSFCRSTGSDYQTTERHQFSSGDTLLPSVPEPFGSTSTNVDDDDDVVCVDQIVIDAEYEKRDIQKNRRVRLPHLRYKQQSASTLTANSPRLIKDGSGYQTHNSHSIVDGSGYPTQTRVSARTLPLIVDGSLGKPCRAAAEHSEKLPKKSTICSTLTGSSLTNPDKFGNDQLSSKSGFSNVSSGDDGQPYIMNVWSEQGKPRVYRRGSKNRSSARENGMSLEDLEPVKTVAGGSAMSNRLLASKSAPVREKTGTVDPVARTYLKNIKQSNRQILTAAGKMLQKSVRHTLGSQLIRDVACKTKRGTRFNTRIAHSTFLAKPLLTSVVVDDRSQSEKVCNTSLSIAEARCKIVDLKAAAATTDTDAGHKIGLNNKVKRKTYLSTDRSNIPHQFSTSMIVDERLQPENLCDTSLTPRNDATAKKTKHVGNKYRFNARISCKDNSSESELKSPHQFAASVGVVEQLQAEQVWDASPLMGKAALIIDLMTTAEKAANSSGNELSESTRFRLKLNKSAVSSKRVGDSSLSIADEVHSVKPNAVGATTDIANKSSNRSFLSESARPKNNRFSCRGVARGTVRNARPRVLHGSSELTMVDKVKISSERCKLVAKLASASPLEKVSISKSSMDVSQISSMITNKTLSISMEDIRCSRTTHAMVSEKSQAAMPDPKMQTSRPVRKKAPPVRQIAANFELEKQNVAKHSTLGKNKFNFRKPEQQILSVNLSDGNSNEKEEKPAKPKKISQLDTESNVENVPVQYEDALDGGSKASRSGFGSQSNVINERSPQLFENSKQNVAKNAAAANLPMLNRMNTRNAPINVIRSLSEVKRTQSSTLFASKHLIVSATPLKTIATTCKRGITTAQLRNIAATSKQVITTMAPARYIVTTPLGRGSGLLGGHKLDQPTNPEKVGRRKPIISNDVITIDDTETTNVQPEVASPAKSRQGNNSLDPAKEAVKLPVVATTAPLKKTVATLVARGSGIPGGRGPGRPRKSDIVCQRSVISDDVITIDDMGIDGIGDNEPHSSSASIDLGYYSQKEGVPAFQEEKGEYMFKCWQCNKIVSGNISMMSHAQEHMIMAPDLSDCGQSCHHCFERFATPRELQNHVEKVHQQKPNWLLCRICENYYQDENELRRHMKQSHKDGEMPYVCQICGYRSSFYMDVINHFNQSHDGMPRLQCWFCLKIFKAQQYKKLYMAEQSTNSAFCITNYFHVHVQKHLVKGLSTKCGLCRLSFLAKCDMSNHISTDHVANSGSIAQKKKETPKVSIELCKGSVTIPGSTVKLLNAPIRSSHIDMASLRVCGVMSADQCLECEQSMATTGHYKSYVACSMCRFATVCESSYLNHMARFHQGKSYVRLQGKLNDSRKRRSSEMSQPTFCLCGFSSHFGTIMASHLVSCGKRTCYDLLPGQNRPECKEEHRKCILGSSHRKEGLKTGVQLESALPGVEPGPLASEASVLPLGQLQQINEESTEKLPKCDVPSMSNSLGPVKSAKLLSHSRLRGNMPEIRNVAAKTIATKILEEILDAMFPAENVAAEILSKLLDRVDVAIQSKETKKGRKRHASSITTSVDDIPEELKGSRKWSTVRIPDKVTPSVTSVFLGTDHMDIDQESIDAVNVFDNDNNANSEPAEECVAKIGYVENESSNGLDDPEVMVEDTLSGMPSSSIENSSFIQTDYLPIDTIVSENMQVQCNGISDTNELENNSEKCDNHDKLVSSSMHSINLVTESAKMSRPHYNPSASFGIEDAKDFAPLVNVNTFGLSDVTTCELQACADGDEKIASSTMSNKLIASNSSSKIHTRDSGEHIESGEDTAVEHFMKDEEVQACGDQAAASLTVEKEEEMVAGVENLFVEQQSIVIDAVSQKEPSDDSILNQNLTQPEEVDYSTEDASTAIESCTVDKLHSLATNAIEEATEDVAAGLSVAVDDEIQQESEGNASDLLTSISGSCDADGVASGADDVDNFQSNSLMETTEDIPVECITVSSFSKFIEVSASQKEPSDDSIMNQNPTQPEEVDYSTEDASTAIESCTVDKLHSLATNAIEEASEEDAAGLSVAVDDEIQQESEGNASDLLMSISASCDADGVASGADDVDNFQSISLMETTEDIPLECTSVSSFSKFLEASDSQGELNEDDILPKNPMQPEEGDHATVDEVAAVESSTDGMPATNALEEVSESDTGDLSVAVDDKIQQESKGNSSDLLVSVSASSDDSGLDGIASGVDSKLAEIVIGTGSDFSPVDSGAEIVTNLVTLPLTPSIEDTKASEESERQCGVETAMQLGKCQTSTTNEDHTALIKPSIAVTDIACNPQAATCSHPPTSQRSSTKTDVQSKDGYRTEHSYKNQDKRQYDHNREERRVNQQSHNHQREYERPHDNRRDYNHQSWHGYRHAEYGQYHTDRREQNWRGYGQDANGRGNYGFQNRNDNQRGRPFDRRFGASSSSYRGGGSYHNTR